MTKLSIRIVPVTPFQQNSSLVWDEDTKQAAVVDPGGDLHLIEAAIAEAGVRVEKILLTHGHVDHAGGAADLAAKLNVPVIGPHIADKPVLDNIPNRGPMFGMPEAKSVTPDQWLKEGDEVKVGGVSFKVIEAPGHSPGSVVLFSAANKFALMGDVLFKNSIGRTDIPFGNHETLMRSIHEKVLPLGDDVQFLPGHGSPSQIGQERKSNPFLKG
jgi:hydroxyacylglutathione hydrolase